MIPFSNPAGLLPVSNATAMTATARIAPPAKSHPISDRRRFGSECDVLAATTNASAQTPTWNAKRCTETWSRSDLMSRNGTATNPAPAPSKIAPWRARAANVNTHANASEIAAKPPTLILVRIAAAVSAPIAKNGHPDQDQRRWLRRDLARIRVRVDVC